MKLFVVVTLTALLLVNICNAGSSSYACTFENGHQKCVNNNDPNGNSASSSSFSNGQQGQMAAGAGRPGAFTVNRGSNEGRR